MLSDRSLYNGLVAGLQRQMCFASIRIGLYDSIKVLYQNTVNGKHFRTIILDLLYKVKPSRTVKKEKKEKNYNLIGYLYWDYIAD